MDMKLFILWISDSQRIILPENGLPFFLKTCFFLLIALMGNAQIRQVIPADASFNPGSELRKLTGSYPGISLAETGDTSSLTIYRNLMYSSSGSRKLHLDLFMRKERDKQKLPLVIFVHGGGWRSGDRSMDHPMAAEMVRRGYAAACVEYRLSGEALYPAGIVDVKTALRWLRFNSRRFSLDRKRFALAGSSAGGQMAALIGTLNGKGTLYRVKTHRCTSDKVQAVVNIDGILAFIHPESGEGNDQPGKTSSATTWFGVSRNEKPALWMEASALNHVNRRSAPVLFINSSFPRFHAGRDDYIRKLDALNIPYVVHDIPGTPHTFWLFNPWFEQTVNYMDQFLKGIFN